MKKIHSTCSNLVTTSQKLRFIAWDLSSGISGRIGLDYAEVRWIRKIASSSGYREVVNHKLMELLKQEHIVPKHPINFVGIAESTVRAFGIPNVFDSALILLNDIFSRKPKATDTSELTRDYVRATVLANLVHYLRDIMNFDLSAVMKDSRVNMIIEQHGIKSSTVEAYFHGKKPNKLIDVSRIWKPKGRTDILSSYNPSRGNFENYLKVVIRNAARDMQRLMIHESNIISRALPLDLESINTRPSDLPSLQELSVDSQYESIAKLSIDQFRKRLYELNPHYLQILRLIRDHQLDPHSKRGINLITEKFRLPDEQHARNLIDSFYSDLRKSLINLGFQTVDQDVAQLIRIATIPI